MLEIFNNLSTLSWVIIICTFAICLSFVLVSNYFVKALELYSEKLKTNKDKLNRLCDIMQKLYDKKDDGMALRDYFAAQALAGLYSRKWYITTTAAEESYRIADAMMKERVKHDKEI